MFEQTDSAILAKLATVTWGVTPEPQVIMAWPSALCRPADPEDYQTPLVVVTRGEEDEDSARLRPGETHTLKLDLVGEELVVMEYPIPFKVPYQIELISSRDPQVDRERQSNAMVESFHRAWRKTGYIPASWTIGDYTVAADLYYHRTGKRNSHNEDGFGIFRTAFLYGIESWLFDSTSQRAAGIIKYRYLSLAKSNDWTITRREHKPDGVAP